MDHGDRLDELAASTDHHRRQAVEELLQDEMFGGMIRHVLARASSGNNDRFFQQVQTIEEQVMDMYKNTQATASECFQELDDRLTEIGMEPDCVGLWQNLLQLKDEEEEWDRLSATEQYRAESVPKGKQRKPLHKYNLRSKNPSTRG